jgi:hypothetical protein
MTEPRPVTNGVRWLRIVSALLVLGMVWGYLLSYYRWDLLTLNTMDSGGDTPSFHRPIEHLKDTLLPAGNPQGWDLGNFAGYAPYQFYFLPPAMLVVALSTVVPFYVAFKLVTALGVFLLPLAAFLAVRGLGLRYPTPLVAAAASLLFLFNEGNSMWGGNIPSTLAGEFAHSIGFALSVAFLGLLYRGVQTQRGWRGLGALLAVAGLCHPIAFLNATAPGVYFLFRRRNFGRNVRYIFSVYATGVLLMGFWLIPLVAKLGYATSINWAWHFNSWGEVLPPILYPVAGLALLDVIWVAVQRSEENGPAYYLITAVVVTVLCFFNATEAGLPEIRFVPFTYMLLILLAVDLARRVVAFLVADRGDLLGTVTSLVAALALVAGSFYWVRAHTSFIANWIEWNYSGVQSKPSWPLLRDMIKQLKGNIGDPRVAYENSPKHDRFGSMRIFESLPFLAGRATLEGVLLQTAVNSPFIYWIQSQISKQGTGVIPGYSYPSLDPVRGTKRLELYNAHDIITNTPEVQKALDGDARWQRTFSRSSYVIYHLKDADPHYVRVPRFEPVLVDPADWKHAFHDWFARDELLDVPLVLAATVPEDQRALFPLTSASTTDLPRQPIDRSCKIDEHLDHMEISFTTTCPGVPHWIAVSYFPNWQVEGARGVYLASPAFMMVIPDGNHVVLRFRRIAVDWIGIAASLVGLALLVMPVPTPRRAVAGVDRALHAAYPVLVPAAIVLALGGSVLSAAREFGPQWFYKRGWAAFSSNDYDTSRREFEWAILLGGHSDTAADATFFRAASLFRSERFEEAMAGYQRIVDEFPHSMWVAESIYHVGLCLRRLGRTDEAIAMFRRVVATYPSDRWAGFSREQLQQLGAAERPSAPQ